MRIVRVACGRCIFEEGLDVHTGEVVEADIGTVLPYTG